MVVITALYLALFCLGTVNAADTGSEADPLLADRQIGGVTFSGGPGGAITIQFGAQSANSPPSMSCGATVADVGVSDGAFVGDYHAAGVESLTFKIVGDGHVPGTIMAILRTNRGRTWYNSNVQVSATAGEETVNTVSFDRSAGWDRNERPSVDKDAMWAADLKDVAAVGVTLTQGGIQAQSYTISHFMLLDRYGGTSGPGTLTPLEQALLDAFGVTDMAVLTEEQQLRDLDGDGMTDLVEIRSELEDGFADSIFAAEIVEIERDGVTIRWPCVAGEKYTVLRSDSLFSLFAPLAGAIELEAAETGFMIHRDTATAGTGPYFYRIFKQKQ